MNNTTQGPGLTKLGKVFLGIFALTLLTGAGWYFKPNLFKSVIDAAVPSEGITNQEILKSGEPTNVCVVTWGGYVGGQYFNGGFAASESSRYFKEYGILVKFTTIDDFESSRDARNNGSCHLLWATVDAFTTEAANLQAAGYNPIFLFQSDWSRGGDAIVVRRGVNSMADLRGKKIAVAFGTPSHTFVLRMLEASGMRVTDVNLMDTGSAIEAANVFKAGQSDAAAVWSPDDDSCINAVPGSKVLVNTKEATHIIADGFFVKREYLDAHRRELTSLVKGWLIGAAEINTNASAKEEAVQILSEGLNISVDEARNAIGRVRLTTYGDNLQFFGLQPRPGFMTGEKLFLESGALYKNNGYHRLVPSLPSWRSITDTSILRDIKLSGTKHEAEGGQRFAAPTAQVAQAQEFSSKQLTVTFRSGSATLDDNAKALIDVGFAPTAQSFAGAHIRIEGNTDKVGSREGNMMLSLRRAQAVADYLATQYGFDDDRFIVDGKGPDNPVCQDDSPDCYARNRRTEFELIRQ